MRRAHRFFGLLAVLPLLAWLISGVGLAVLETVSTGAGEVVLPTQPLRGVVTVRPEPGVGAVRVFETALGQHLIQETEFGPRHLDPRTGELKAVPAEADLRLLLDEAFALDPAGFGEVELITADSTVTSTGRVIELDWPSFTATYRDGTTRLANVFRRVHGLGLSGIAKIDRWITIVAGALGLVLALLGLVLLTREEGGDVALDEGRR